MAKDPAAGVTSAIEGRIANLVFANPAQRGALTPEMLRSLREELVGLERRHPELRVVILRGADRTFSSGYAIDRIPEADELALKDDIEWLCEAIEASPLVVIAALRDLVVGAALDIASACDMRMAERGCRLGITPARLGIVYSVSGMARIHRLVGPDWTRVLFFTGDLVDAEQASRIGLVTEVCDAPDLENETRELARRIASRAPLSLSGSKQILRVLEASTQPDPATLERLHELRRRALRSPDVLEGRAAFAEKRQPTFTGEA